MHLWTYGFIFYVSFVSYASRSFGCSASALVLLLVFMGLHLNACPHLFPIQAILFPETKSPVSETSVDRPLQCIGLSC